MITNYGHLKQFIQYNIDSMYSSIEYAVEHGRDGKYALWAVDKYDAQAFGAMMFVKNHLNGINENEFQELSSWLFYEWREAHKQAMELKI